MGLPVRGSGGSVGAHRHGDFWRVETGIRLPTQDQAPACILEWVPDMRGCWHVDEMYVKLNVEKVYLCPAIDQEGGSSGELHHQYPRQECGDGFHEEDAETLRIARGDHDRRASAVQGCDEWARKFGHAGDREVGEQPLSELASSDAAGRLCNSAQGHDDKPGPSYNWRGLGEYVRWSTRQTAASGCFTSSTLS